MNSRPGQLENGNDSNPSNRLELKTLSTVPEAKGLLFIIEKKVGGEPPY
jgi:hypothetical protein